MPRAGASVEIRLNALEARNAIYDATLAALGAVFEDNVLPDAKQLSPAEPIAHPAWSTHNRDSLEIKVFGTKKGPFAKIYSTSDHGGYLEVGTRNMSAQPYIWPALQMNLARIISSIREKIQAITITGNQPAEGRKTLPED